MVSLVGGGFCILGIHLVPKCEILSSTRLDNEGFVQLDLSNLFASHVGMGENWAARDTFISFHPGSVKLVQVRLTKQFFLDSFISFTVVGRIVLTPCCHFWTSHWVLRPSQVWFLPSWLSGIRTCKANWRAPCCKIQWILKLLSQLVVGFWSCWPFHPS